MNGKLSKEIRRLARANAEAHAKSDTNVVEAVLQILRWPLRYRVKMAWRILRGVTVGKGGAA